MINLYVNTDAGGGGDGSAGTPWNTLADAITALESSGPAARGDAVTVNCSGVTADTDVGGVLNQFDISTTVTFYLLIQGDNTSGVFDETKYRIEFGNRNGLYNNVTSHLRYNRLQVQHSVSSGGFVSLKTANGNIVATDAEFECSNCIVKGVMTGGTVLAFENSDLDAAGQGTSIFWNCLAYDCQIGFDNLFINGANIGQFANCDAIDCSFGFINNTNGAMEVINCLASNVAGIGFVAGGTFAVTSDYNACDDGNSIPGANSNNVAVFTFNNAAADDFRLSPDDLGALGLGTTAPLGVTFDDDLQGSTRPVAWAIGALEIPYVEPPEEEMPTITAAMSGVPYTLQSAATTGSGNIVSPPMSFKHHQLLVSVPAGVSAGAIQPEASNDDTYSGTWAPVGGGPVTVPAASSSLLIEFTGIYRFIRARITTTVSGGGTPSVTVDYTGSQW